jgi:SAM-dependent methyltransferase
MLAIPAVYRLFIRLVEGDFYSAYVNTYVRPRPGDRILDIGCGPGDILNHLPSTDYYGIDLSAEYIEAARARFGSRGTFIRGEIGKATVEQPGTYDLALANGVLHHLEEETALELFRLARSALKPGGRLVTHDGCYAPGQSRVARWLLRMDRGKHVRAEEEYRRLACSVFPTVKTYVLHGLLRLPYTHLIMECSA